MTRLYRKLRLGAGILTIAMAACSLALAERHEPVVTAYVFAQNNALTPDSVDGHALTRINYAFANIANGRIVTGFANDDANYATLTALRKQKPSLKVLVSVGGWEWSKGFSDVSLTAASRATFIDSVMEFLTRYDLDGLDIDWEYPGMRGAGNVFRDEDKHNFTLLLGELRKRFKAEEKKTHRHLYLTIAAGSSQEFIAHTEMAEIAKILDTVNLMAYDYYEPSDNSITGHHAPLYANPADPQKASTDASVQAFKNAGVPARKIVLGVPFYGHIWGEVPATANGLYQPGKPIPGAYSSYNAIKQNMLGQGYTRYWDSVSSVPYLYNAEKKIFVSYEDPESLAVKARYVHAQHLGGMMFWSYEGDAHEELLHAIDAGLGIDTAK